MVQFVRSDLAEDPLVPVRIPRVRYLPLYYSFVYNAGAVGYQVVSDTEINILYLETTKVEPNFPYENYPAAFPETPVSLSMIASSGSLQLFGTTRCRTRISGTTTQSRARRVKQSSKSAQSAERFMRATAARDTTL